MPRIAALYRYPVKGFSPERLGETRLEPGRTIAGDRAYAVENGPSGFDPAAPGWRPKIKFLCWMRNPRIARLRTRFDDASGVLSIEADGFGAVSGDLGSDEGRRAITEFLEGFMGEERRGPLRLLAAPGHSFSDVARQVVSVINPASAADLVAALGGPVDPLRFRGNLHVEELAAWAESDWLGRTLAVGAEVRLNVVKRTQRCLATHVDPERGVRDLDVMDAIRSRSGDLDCGVYAEVAVGGVVREGDEIRVAE